MHLDVPGPSFSIFPPPGVTSETDTSVPDGHPPLASQNAMAHFTGWHVEPAAEPAVPFRHHPPPSQHALDSAVTAGVGMLEQHQYLAAPPPNWFQPSMFENHMIGSAGFDETMPRPGPPSWDAAGCAVGAAAQAMADDMPAPQQANSSVMYSCPTTPLGHEPAGAFLPTNWRLAAAPGEYHVALANDLHFEHGAAGYQWGPSPNSIASVPRTPAGSENNNHNNNDDDDDDNTSALARRRESGCLPVHDMTRRRTPHHPLENLPPPADASHWASTPSSARALSLDLADDAQSCCFSTDSETAARSASSRSPPSQRPLAPPPPLPMTMTTTTAPAAAAQICLASTLPTTGGGSGGGSGSGSTHGNTGTAASKNTVQARNRAAASRYRAKTQAASAQLQAEERSAAARHRALVASAGQLRDEVYRLKNELLRHADCDCPLIRGYLSHAAAQACAGLRRASAPEPGFGPGPSGTGTGTGALGGDSAGRERLQRFHSGDVVMERDFVGPGTAMSV